MGSKEVHITKIE